MPDRHIVGVTREPHLDPCCVPQLTEGGIEIDVDPSRNGLEDALVRKQSSEVEQKIRARGPCAHLLVFRIHGRPVLLDEECSTAQATLCENEAEVRLGRGDAGG